MQNILEPLNRQERRNTIDMLQGCINRICVTDDFEELFRLLIGAQDYISTLAYSRFLKLKEIENER